MKALILAAGRGSRLGALTKNKPKCLYEFAGKTLLQWQIDALKPYVKNIGVVVGYKAETITLSGISKIENTNWMNSNSIRSLVCAAEWIGEDDCIISYSDIIYSRHLINTLQQTNCAFALAYSTQFRALWTERFKEPLKDLESFKIKDGHIFEIGKKVDNIDDIEGQYMGLLRLRTGMLRKFLSYLSENFTPTQINMFDFTTALNNYIENGGKVIGVSSDELWLEFDTEQDVKLYKKYETDFLRSY